MSDQGSTAIVRRTLTPKFWLWRCDNCGLLAYPPEGDEAAEPQVNCPCWKGPRWVRYFAMTPSTPESRDAARRARAAENGSPEVRSDG